MGGLGPDLSHIVAARRLAPDDLPGAVNRLGVVDAFAWVADPDPGGSALAMDAEAAISKEGRLG